MIVVALLVAACTGDGDDDGSPTPAPSSTTTSPVPTGPVRFEPGLYRYEFGGVTADLRFTGSDATMDVKNASGAELGPPALYVIDGAGAQHDGVVAGAASIPDGETTTFEVAFPAEVNEETIGLVALVFGDANYGLFAPVPVAD